MLQGLGPIFVRKAGFSGLAFAFNRMWLATSIYLVIGVVRGTPITWTAIRTSLVGGLTFAFNIATFFVAVKRTSVANATIIGALQPVALLMVVNRLFGERPGRQDIVWTAVSIAGVAIVVMGSGTAKTGNPSGDALAFVAMLGYAAYFAASKRARQTLSAFEYQAAFSLVATVALVPLIVVHGDRLSAPHATSWLWVVAMVALPGTGHLLLNYAHEYVRLSLLGLLTLLNPVVSTLLAWLLLDERLVLVQIAGMAVVIGALGVMVTDSSRAVLRPARLQTD
jgi:drug/metabolite transporter (DMT)-like permease